ncbi:MAG: hypothetical protein ABH879_07140 [archaeon]
MRRLLLVFLIFAGCTQSLYRGNVPEGTFTAMIGDSVVFTNGADILKVSPGGADAGLCFIDEEYFCTYRLGIVISDAAAERQAETTSKLDVVDDHLSESLKIFLNNELLGDVMISSELRGRFQNEVQIMGTATGETEENALAAAKERYEQLYKVLSDIS